MKKYVFAAITKEELKTLKAIYKENGDFAQRLKAKCNWEHMTPIAVLREGWFAKELKEFKRNHNEK